MAAAAGAAIFLPFVKGAASAVGGQVANSVLAKFGIGDGAKLEKIAGSLDRMSEDISDLKGGHTHTHQQLDKITSDLNDISKSLNNIQDEVKKIDTAMVELSKQIFDVVKQLTLNELNNATTTINSICDSVTSIMALLSGDIRDNKMDKIKDGRQELRHRLRNAQEELPILLSLLNQYLTQNDANGIIVMVRSKALEDGTDFVTYWMRMRIFIARYWFAQARAIAVLSTSHYYQGDTDVAKFGNNLKSQLDLFEEIVGKPVCNIMNQLTAVKENDQLERDYLTVQLCSNRGKFLLVDQSLNVQYSRILFTGQSEILNWQLHPQFDCHPAKLNLEDRHNFEIKILNGALKGTITAGQNGDGKRTPAVLYNKEQADSPQPYKNCTSDLFLLWRPEPNNLWHIQAQALKDGPLLFTAAEQWGAQGSYDQISAQTVWGYNGLPDLNVPDQHIIDTKSTSVIPDSGVDGRNWWIQLVDGK